MQGRGNIVGTPRGEVGGKPHNLTCARYALFQLFCLRLRFLLVGEGEADVVCAREDSDGVMSGPEDVANAAEGDVADPEGCKVFFQLLGCKQNKEKMRKEKERSFSASFILFCLYACTYVHAMCTYVVLYLPAFAQRRYSASVKDKVTFFCPQDFYDTRQPITKTQNPLTLNLVSLSPAKSLSQ